jgi:outer membrane protein W
MKRVGIALTLTALCLAASGAGALDLAKKGGIGGSGGIMTFTSGEDFSTDNRVRFVGQAVFKYNFTQNLAAVLESGFGWNSYDSGSEEVNDTLAVVIPTTLGAMYRIQYGDSKFWPHAGAGLGLYSLGIKDSFRSWANGNMGTERLTWTSPGGYLRVGGEYLFENGAAINVEVLFHSIFSDESDRFPDGWGNQNTSFAQLRVGANYYFSLGGGSDAVPSGQE